MPQRSSSFAESGCCSDGQKTMASIRASDVRGPSVKKGQRWPSKRIIVEATKVDCDRLLRQPSVAFLSAGGSTPPPTRNARAEQ